MPEVGLQNRLVIRDLEISPPIALAPMVGLSHSAFRTLVQEEGGVGLLFTEMLTAKRLPNDNEKCSPLLIRRSSERPLFYQLIVSTDQYIQSAVEKLHKLDAQGIDLNLGCPAPKLMRQGAGASLAENREMICRILKVLRKNTELPVSVKIRLGDKLDASALKQFCILLEGEGVDLITIHARLKGEKFCRKPRWSAIAEAKKAVSIPVLANGGIFSTADAKTCLKQSGADGVMIGRGAVEKPWLCAEIAKEIYGMTCTIDRTKEDQLFDKFITLLEERFPPERRLGRLKQFTQYFALPFQFGHHLVTAVQTSDSIDQARGRAHDFFFKGEKSIINFTGVDND